MTDLRPLDCRFRSQEEGRPYPRSGCRACGRTITTGLGNRCYLERDPPERTYTQAEFDAAVQAAYEDAAKVAVEMAGYASDENDHGVCMAVAATIRERGE